MNIGTCKSSVWGSECNKGVGFSLLLCLRQGLLASVYAKLAGPGACKGFPVSASHLSPEGITDMPYCIQPLHGLWGLTLGSPCVCFTHRAIFPLSLEPILLPPSLQFRDYRRASPHPVHPVLGGELHPYQTRSPPPELQRQSMANVKQYRRVHDIGAHV